MALSMEILRVEEKTWKVKGVKFDAAVVELVALRHDVDEHRFHGVLLLSLQMMWIRRQL